MPVLGVAFPGDMKKDGERSMKFRKKMTTTLLSLALPAIFAGAASATTYYNDFSTLGASPSLNDLSQPYSLGGVTVQYIGASPASYQSEFVPGSNYSWYPSGGATGYDAITLTGGGSFFSALIQAGSGWGGGTPDLTYRLLNGSTVVGTGDAGALPNYGGGFSNFSFAGAFTEIDLQGPLTTTFSASNYEALNIGSITLDSSAPAPTPGEGLPNACGVLVLIALAARFRGLIV